jgi:hypothetical protein
VQYIEIKEGNMKAQKTYRITKKLLKNGQKREAYKLILDAITREIDRRCSSGIRFYTFQELLADRR